MAKDDKPTVGGSKTRYSKTAPKAGEIIINEIQPFDPGEADRLLVNGNKRRASQNQLKGTPTDRLLLEPPNSRAAATTHRPRTNANTSQVRGNERRPTDDRNRSFHQNDSLPAISDETRQEIYGLILLLLGVVLFVGMFAQDGFVATWAVFARQVIGVGAFLVPPAIMFLGAALIWEGLTHKVYVNAVRILGGSLILLGLIGLAHLSASDGKALAASGGGGGTLGYYAVTGLSAIVTHVGVFFVLLALVIVGAILAFDLSLRRLPDQVAHTYKRLTSLRQPQSSPYPGYPAFDDKDEADQQPAPVYADDSELLDNLLLHGPPVNIPRQSGPLPEANVPNGINLIGEPEKLLAKANPGDPLVNTFQRKKSDDSELTGNEDAQRPLQQNWKRDELMSPMPSEVPQREWILPRINLLANITDSEIDEDSARIQLLERAKLIEKTLGNFGIEAFVREVNRGPTVTQYALEPGIGVKVARIVALANDLALALAAPAIRIEAPVPGQSRVGVEVPNLRIATVGLREIIESDEFIRKAGKLKIALGRDVSGLPMVADLSKMPHLLIAGATGSGKSVAINTVVAGFLLQYRPNELQFIMIDPKMVELSTYNGIPHLRFPVVTQIEADPEKERDHGKDLTPTVMSVLKWAIREMEKRYKKLSYTGHRNLEAYNKVAGVGNDWEKLPYLVLIIDELADLMMVAPEEAEASICRLAQKARAVGIHLILATQRPSVDVVTGLIKANFPSRMTFAVTSQIDSRVILDSTGAEKLLGRGDMLYLASDAGKPVRIQGTYVSDEEIDALVRFWKNQTNFVEADSKAFVQPDIWPEDLREIEAERTSKESDGDDLFEAALEVVREARTASTSLLQRRLRIGYNRAAHLIELLEQAKVIGTGDGGKPRAVLFEEQDFGTPTTLADAAADFQPVKMSVSAADFQDDDPPL